MPPLRVGELHPVADDERPRHRLPRGRRRRLGLGGDARRLGRPSAVSCCVSTGGQPTDGAGCDPWYRMRRGHSELSVGRPSLGPMTAIAARPEPAADGPRRRRSGGRRRAGAAPSLAVAQPGGRLQDLPAALPLPHDRPAARAQEPRRRPRHARALGARAALRPARRPGAPSPPRRTSSSPAWAELRDEPGVAELFAAAQDDGAETDANAPESVDAWLASAGKLVEKYFTLEDPTRIQPHGREELVEVTLPDGLLLRGFVDRLDVAPTAPCGSSTTRPARCRARPSRPRRCSR